MMPKRIPPSLTLEYDIKIHDQDGNLVDHEHGISRSFVLGFLAIMLAGIKSADGGTDYPDINGVNQNLSGVIGTGSSFNTAPFSRGQATVVTDGLVVGTGVTAVTPTDNKLEIPIAHGSGAGQLTYSAQVALDTDVSIVGLVVSARALRTFVNNSAGTININEIGWYAGGHISANGGLVQYCIIRDILITPKIVLPTFSATITYTISTTA